VTTPEPKPATPERTESRFSWMDFLKVVALPVVTLILGFVFNSSLDARHTNDNDIRLYAEMMGRREQADSDLRKDMFKSILDTFMSKDPKLEPARELRQQVLNLELLAYNFHESLDIGPLFKDVRSRISDEPTGPNAQLRRRLEKVAREVIERQLTALSDSGMIERGDTAPEGIAQLHAFLYFGSHVVPDPDVKPGEGVPSLCLWMDTPDQRRHYRQFKLEIIDFDPQSREIQVRLTVSQPVTSEECRRVDLKGMTEMDGNFWVGLFDFPMIDNTRLSEGERCAVSLLELGPGVLNVALSYFPGSRASLKDKPYYDEVVRELLQKRSAPNPGGHRPSEGTR
jgi:hypothetical protein